MSTTALTEDYRKATLALRAGTLQDFLRLWPLLDRKRLDVTFPGWLSAVSTLIERDRGRAAGLSSAYLRRMRQLADVPGEPVIRLVTAAPRAQVAASMSATAYAGYFTAIRTTGTAAAAERVALVKASGAATRLVLNAGRDTVRASLAADPRAEGWRRITSGRACEFCAMLAGRGAVYSAATADFASHDHCSCSAEPVYRTGRVAA